MALETVGYERVVLLPDHVQQRTHNYAAWLGRKSAGAIDVRYATLRSRQHRIAAEWRRSIGVTAIFEFYAECLCRH
jgi:hypothetical protein